MGALVALEDRLKGVGATDSVGETVAVGKLVGAPLVDVGIEVGNAEGVFEGSVDGRKEGRDDG